MSYLLLSIFCAVAIVAFSNAQQINVNPQAFEESSLQSSEQKQDLKYTTITLYLTPSEMKALAGGNYAENSEIQMQEGRQQENGNENKRDNENQQEQERGQEGEQEQSDYQSYNQQQQSNGFNVYNNIPSSMKEPKAELRGLLAHNSFYPKEENSNYENQQWNYDENSYSKQMPNEEQKQMAYFELIKNEPHNNLQYQEESKNQQQSEQSEWIPFNPESANKDKALLYDQLKQQEDNINDQNKLQLKGLSAISQEYENMKKANTEYNAAEMSQLNSEEKSEIEKQIEFILRQEQAFEDQKQSGIPQREANKQKLPIIIHKEISVTRHHPVPVYKKVKVPAPVLVPIPEPYEVKIPYRVPVPYKVIKHIPVPVIKYD